jgi:acyl carrier protein
MDKGEIENRMFGILCRVYGVDPQAGNVTMEDIRRDFYLDSTNAVALVMELQMEFEFEVADEDVNDEMLSSVDSVCAYVAGKLGR